MTQQPEMLYLGILLALLVLMRSTWPWTRTGGLVLLAAAALAAWWTRLELLAAALDPGRLPPTLLALLAASVTWWSLHSAGRGSPVSGSRATGAPGSFQSGRAPTRRRASRLRFAGVALGVLAVASLAVFLGAPAVVPSDGVPERGPTWFLAGLLALAPMTGGAYAFGVVPLVALIGLLLAPDLDARDEHGGRRDEPSFFLFAWLAVGVVPIVLAAWMPSFARPDPVAAAGLAERFWLNWLGLPSPDAWMLRELPGFLLYAAIFAFLPWKLPSWKASKGVFGRHLRRLGPMRYALVMGLAGALVLVPLKVALYVFFGVGPWIVLGEIAL